jgi:cell division protein FtsI (penicillin-binding protein 3)
MKASKDIRFRVYITFLFMCLFAIAIIVKAARIQVNEGKELLAIANSKHTKIEVIQPERGNIYSEDGSLLSSSIPEFDLHVDFAVIQPDTFSAYLEPLSKQLEAIFKDKSWQEYKEILAKEYNNESHYFLLKKKATYAQYIELKKVTPFDKGINKGGLIAQSNTKRINPFGLFANRVIGLYRQNAQNVGIENQFDTDLRGSQGQRIVRQIAGGTWMPIDGSEIDPENGRDVMTTLDVNIQDVAENALLHQLEKEQATFGTCIVMEVKTGKIKAMANLGKQANGTYYEDFNYALKRIEPGSTFKLVSLISLMRDKLIKTEDKVNCQGGTAHFGPYIIRDSHEGLGTLTIKNAFAHSSNVAFAKLIHSNYKDKIGTYWTNLHALGLDKKTGLGLSGEVNPTFIKDSVTKGRYSLAYLGMGYQVLITPLHTCMVYNAIANNGKLMQPYLINSVQEYGKDVIKYEPTILNNEVLDSASIVSLKETMNEVVESGTGKDLKNQYYTICGKTGTAQVADKGIKYTDKVYHGSFVGFFPKDDPQYTICVVLRTRKGSSNYYGGLIALPVFKEVANRLFAINSHNVNQKLHEEKLNVALKAKSIKADEYNMLSQKLSQLKKVSSQGSWLQNIHVDSTGNLTFAEVKEFKNLVPDVNGMGLRDAIYLLEKNGLRVIPQGNGKVVAQSILPGSYFTKGQQITIQLS